MSGLTSRSWRVIWSRGAGCRALAERLGDAVPVDGDLRASVIRARADILVARKASSFDLVATAVPSGFEPDEVTEIVAAVGGGPHSELAGRVASKLAAHLEIPGRLITGSPSREEDFEAESTLAALTESAPGLSPKVVRAGSAKDLVEGLGPGSLLVLGAPGGSWLQRQFFGPGRKLVVSAPGGSIVVRSAPARCFQSMDEPTGFGPAMPAREALRLLREASAPVVDAGILIGIIDRETLRGAAADAVVGDLAGDAVFVHDTDPIEAVAEVVPAANPVPVVDARGRLVGVIRG